MRNATKANAIAVFMAVTLDDLRAKVNEIKGEIEAVIAAADKDDRDISDDEFDLIEARKTEMEMLTRQISAREAAEAVRATAMAGTGRKSTPEASKPGAGAKSYPSPRDPKAGFSNFGEFALMVRRGCQNDQDAVQRLSNAASSWGGENVGADGGFAVPPEFRSAIAIKINGPDSLLSMTDQLTTSSNTITIPKDETTPWQSTGGILAYWENEGQTIPGSKPLLDQSTIRLNKLTALVPVSDELLEDAAGIDSYLRTKAPQKMVAKLNTAIINGTGAGQPLGILQSASLQTVAGKTGQGSTTVIYPNIVDMWNGLYGQWRRNAVWLVNQDVEPQLAMMAFQSLGTPAGTIPVYLPGNTIANAGYDTLKGRPVIPCEACSVLGNVGDIILVDLSQYMTVTKGDIRTDVSIHLYFDQDLTAFRFIFRVAGQPWWSNKIIPQNPKDGTEAAKRSWAVALSGSRNT
jgi:HK97 family phage major capsid protein